MLQAVFDRVDGAFPRADMIGRCFRRFGSDPGRQKGSCGVRFKSLTRVDF